MNYNVYLDESGNTGNIEINDDLEWNFKNQKYFALGAVYIEESSVKRVEEKIFEILHKYDSKLGTENELKSRAKYKYRNDLFKELTGMLLKNQADFYFDISNKKYKIMMKLVQYATYPYYMYDMYWNRNEKIEVANCLYETLSNETIKKYIDICQKEYNEESIEELLKLLFILKAQYKGENNPISFVIKYVKDYKDQKLDVNKLFPIKDYNNKGSKEAFLPNVDAYLNLINTIVKLKINKDDFISIYHDEQKQFSSVLKTWTKSLKDDSLNINQIKFVNSKKTILIQISDFYTGNIVRLYRKIVNSENLTLQDKELIKILDPLFEKINVVAPSSEIQTFFEKCGLKYVKSQIPF